MSGELLKKLKENVHNGFYIVHAQGNDLFDIDLQELLDTKSDEVKESVQEECKAIYSTKIQELEDKIKELTETITSVEEDVEA